ncbi:MAG: AmmeMemoRadiSam system protein A [Gammaproteobacteria bacterium]
MSHFPPAERKILLELVDASIRYGLKQHRPMPIDVSAYPKHLQENGAAFVTLELDGNLRGCIGSLEAYRPLVQDVAQNAFAAAFHDPRFSPLNTEEYPLITKHISVLSKPEPLLFTSEEDLIHKIRPNIDGLVLIEKGLRGTFLPAVWESLPNPHEFLRHLKMKAGLAPNYWSETIRIERYTAEIIE